MVPGNRTPRRWWQISFNCKRTYIYSIYYNIMIYISPERIIYNAVHVHIILCCSSSDRAIISQRPARYHWFPNKLAVSHTRINNGLFAYPGGKQVIRWHINKRRTIITIMRYCPRKFARLDAQRFRRR